MEYLIGKNIDELQQIAVTAGLPRFAGKQLAEWLYKKRAETFDEMTNISIKGRQMLANRFGVGRTRPVAAVESKDGTKKFLFQVGQEHVETVLIPEEDRHTLCISTQAGCRMRCALRSAVSSLTKAVSSRLCLSVRQSTQVSSLSWQ